MKRIELLAAVSVATMALSTPAIAKQKDATYVMVNEEMGVPVFPHDITDKPKTRAVCHFPGHSLCESRPIFFPSS